MILSQLKSHMQCRLVIDMYGVHTPSLLQKDVCLVLFFFSASVCSADTCT